MVFFFCVSFPGLPVRHPADLACPSSTHSLSALFVWAKQKEGIYCKCGTKYADVPSRTAGGVAFPCKNPQMSLGTVERRPPPSCRGIAWRQEATREENSCTRRHFSPHTHTRTPDGEAHLACEARITEWRTDSRALFYLNCVFLRGGLLS